MERTLTFLFQTKVYFFVFNIAHHKISFVVSNQVFHFWNGVYNFHRGCHDTARGSEIDKDVYRNVARL